MGQGVQEVDPAVGLYEPAEHNVQLVIPLNRENAPAGHSTHEFADVAPATAPALPGGQAMQELLSWPSKGLYLPAGHWAHAESDVEAISSLKVPAGQLVQYCLAMPEEKVPLPQAEQDVEPGTRLMKPGAQGWHAATELAPNTVLKYPAPHDSHDSAPGALE